MNDSFRLAMMIASWCIRSSTKYRVMTQISCLDFISSFTTDLFSWMDQINSFVNSDLWHWFAKFGFQGQIFIGSRQIAYQSDPGKLIYQMLLVAKFSHHSNQLQYILNAAFCENFTFLFSRWLFFLGIMKSLIDVLC